MESLLGQFYTRIKGSQEDIASEGLTYVLQRSFSARQALNKIIQADSGLIYEDINYSAQNVGENLERPDISGIDKNGKEIIILEAKFWAALTSNQPVEYLRRLGDNSILMFVVPTARVRPVFNELQMRLANAEIEFVPNNTNHYFSLNHNRKLTVKTWQEILGTIRLHLAQANEQTLLSDIDQIIGLCDSIDNDSFQPYRNEDFAPGIAQKINSFYNLVDKIIHELENRKLASTAGRNATPQRFGYTRYFQMKTMDLSLHIRFDLWAKGYDTPFWLYPFDTGYGGSWKQTEPFKAKIKKAVIKNSIIPYESNKRELFIPVYPLTDKTEDTVINDITNQIIKLADELMM